MQFKTASFIETICLALCAIVFALCAWIFVAVTSDIPTLDSLIFIWRGAFGSLFAWEQTLRAATPLIFTGLCVALAGRTGLLVTGGEGAFIVASLGAAVMATMVPQPIAMVGLVVTGSLFGALWLAISGWLRVKQDVHEAVSGLLLTYLAIALVSQLIEGPFRDPLVFEQPATLFIPIAAQISNLSDEISIHWGLPVGILFCIVAFVIVEHSVWGYRIRVSGGNPQAAMFARIQRSKHVVIVCLCGGGLVGLAAAIDIGAIHHRASVGLVWLGYGYVGILVAALARNNLLLVIPAAILVGGLEAGGGMLQRRLGAPASTALLMHGLLFISVMACSCGRNQFVNWWLQRRQNKNHD